MFLQNRYILFFCLLVAGLFCQGQQVIAQGKVKDLFKVTPPKIKYVRPDTTVLIKYEDFPEDSSEAEQSIYFKPEKELSIVSEDTSTLDLGEQSIVEISEEILIDSSWIKIAGYYAIWDTRNINPYKMDGRQLEDTINLKLVDLENDHLWKMPLHSTPITSHFGPRGYRWHYGTDIDIDNNDSILAAFDGVVRISKWDGSGYGNYLVIRHYNGLETLYGHLNKPLVETGQFVKAGQLIGWGGSTGRSSGPHLHYEVRYMGNPINPELMYDFPEYLLKSPDFQITASLFNYYNSAKQSSARRGTYHRIRSGDTLSGIARKYGVSVSQLTRLNKMSANSTLRIGRTIRIR